MPPRDGRTVTDVKREKKRGQLSRLERELANDRAHTPRPKRDLTVQAARKGGSLPGHLLADPVVRAKLKKAGVTPNFDGGLIGKIGSNIVEDAIYTPAGIYELLKAVGGDVRDVRRGDIDFGRSRNLGKAIGESVVETVRHPGRRPGSTLLLGLGAAGAAGGATARVAAGARQAARGAGVKAVIAAPGYKGGSLLRAPNPGPRVLREGDLEVQGIYSRNAAARAVQKIRDRANSGQPGVRQVSTELAGERRLTEAIERAPAGALSAKARRLTTPQETAIRVVAEGKPIADRIAAHKRDLEGAKGQSVGDLRQKILLLQAAEKYVENVDGKPVFRPDFKTPRLGGGVLPRKGVGPDELPALYAQTRDVALAREKVLQDIGRLTEESVGSRTNAPGRVIEGARMETGREATAARGQSPKKARVEQTVEYPARSKSVTRPRTREEAGARLAELEGKHDAFFEKVWRMGEHRLSAGDKVEQARRNAESGKARLQQAGVTRAGRVSGSSGKKAKLWGTTVKGEVRAEVEMIARSKIEKLPVEHPARRRFEAEQNEMDQLRQVISDHDLAVFDGTPDTDFGAATKTIPGKPRRVELAAQEATPGVKATPRLIGAEEFAGGDFRVPYTPSQAPKANATAARYRGGVPRELATTTNTYTGGLQRSGNFRDRSSKLVSESNIEAQRFAGLLRLRDRVLAAAKDEPFEGAVPIKTDALKGKSYPAAVERIMAKADEGATLSKSEQKMIGDQYESLRERVFPADPIEGVKWVDEKLLDGLDKPGAPLEAAVGHGTVKVIDGINNAQRAAILYLKPAYATPNILGNASLNLIQQGFAAPANLARAARANHLLGDDALAVLDATIGEGFVQSIAGDGRGLGTKGIQAAANLWSRGVDLPFRRSSFFYEARRAGYKTPGRIQELLLNPVHRQDLLEVSRRANEEIIDYSSLSRKERDVIRRVIFFYPWVKGSTAYSGRFLRDHPVKAAAGSQLAIEGKAQSDEDLGPKPSYAAGVFKVGERDGMPVISNPNSASTFGTPAGLIETARGLLSGDQKQAHRLAGMFTPAISAPLAAITQRDSFSGRELKGQSAGEILLKELTGSLPQVVLKSRIDQAATDQSDRLYPMSRRDAVKQFVIGSVAPRPVNRTVLNARAKEENLADLSPEKSAYRKVFEQREEFFVAAKQAMPEALEQGKLPRKLRVAFNVEAERQAAYAKAAKGLKTGTPEYHLAKYTADLRLLVKHGLVKQDRAAAVLANARDASLADLKKARAGISERYYQSEGGPLFYISHARGALREKGVEVG